jgi:fused signal recognition particle receptor
MEQILQLLQADPTALSIVIGAGVALVAVGFGLGRATARRAPLLEDEEGSEGPEALPEPPRATAPSGPTVLDRFRKGLSRTSQALGLGAVFSRDQVDDGLFEDLEDALISADVGVTTTTALIDDLRARSRAQKIDDPKQLHGELNRIVKQRLGRMNPALNPAPSEGPLVILVVGVNGSGKTTTIGKLASRFMSEGRSVLLGAGDTFRAGAIEQLRIWSERSGADFVAHQEGSDPAAVLYDALEAAKARGIDVVICDTAGRLQSQKPLMEELGKVTRVISRAVPGAPHEVLLVLDATIGQNALSQARVFGEVVGVTGIVLTKLDGTAKGGVVVAVRAESGVPVKFVGVGEQVDDLRPFDAAGFAEALFSG